MIINVTVLVPARIYGLGSAWQSTELRLQDWYNKYFDLNVSSGRIILLWHSQRCQVHFGAYLPKFWPIF